VGSDGAGSGGCAGKLREVRDPTLFENSHALRQLRLCDLAEALGEEGWLKVLRLDDYAARRSRQPETLQQMLFPYTEAI
jgi:hypothetical protein